MKNYSRITLCTFFAILAGSSCLGQPAISTPQFGSFGGGPDVINLGNLNAHWDIPIRNKAGRGTNFTYNVTYDSSIWYPVTSGSTKAWQPVANWGWTGLTQAGSIYASYCDVLHIRSIAVNMGRDRGSRGFIRTYNIGIRVDCTPSRAPPDPM